MTASPSFFRRHRFLASFLLSILSLVLLLLLFVSYRAIGPYRSYRADIQKPAPGQSAPPGTLEVGVARRDAEICSREFRTLSASRGTIFASIGID